MEQLHEVTMKDKLENIARAIHAGGQSQAVRTEAGDHYATSVTECLMSLSDRLYVIQMQLERIANAIESRP